MTAEERRIEFYGDARAHDQDEIKLMENHAEFELNEFKKKTEASDSLITSLKKGWVIEKIHHETEECTEFLFLDGNSFGMRGWGTAFGTVNDRLVEIVTNPENWSVIKDFLPGTNDSYPWSVDYKKTYLVYHAKNSNFGIGEHPEFNDDNYELVAKVKCKNLEDVFNLTQTIEQAWLNNKSTIESFKDACRSTSVGDVIVINSNKFRCENTGWKKI